MNETTTTPPERCPICNAPQTDDTEYLVGPDYICGIYWNSLADPPEFAGDCEVATAAALRCHATLAPTAAEQAREALVERTLKLAKRLRRYKPLMDVSELNDDDPEDSATIDMHMEAVLFLADVDAYLAAQPQVPA